MHNLSKNCTFRAADGGGREAMTKTPTTHRRSVLKLGLAGGALLSVGGLGWLGLRNTNLGPDPRRPLRALSREEFAVVSAITACMLPAPVANLELTKWPSGWQMHCPEKVDEVVATLHPEAANEFKQLLRLFENGISGLLTHGRPAPFTQLSSEAQADRLNAWRHSRITLLRSGYLALTRLVHATYHSSPEVFAAMGYPGPPEVPFVPETSTLKAGQPQP